MAPGAYSRVGSFGTAVVNFDVTYAGGNPNKDVVLTYIYIGSGGD